MIAALDRYLKIRRLRREMRAKQKAFAHEPLIMNIAAIIETSTPELRAELVGYVAEGVQGAMDTIGCSEPWGAETEAVARKVCGELLGGALQPDFVAAVMRRLEYGAAW